MSILSAYYLPEAGRKMLYPAITPVNSFRVVLDSSFGAGLPLLPDRSFFSIWDEPYKYVDVTATLREDAARRDAKSQPIEGSEGKGVPIPPKTDSAASSLSRPPRQGSM